MAVKKEDAYPDEPRKCLRATRDAVWSWPWQSCRTPVWKHYVAANERITLIDRLSSHCKQLHV